MQGRKRFMIDPNKARVTGPFTSEAVPAPTVKPLDDIYEPLYADVSVVRTGETMRQGDWLGEFLKTGIRGKAGQRVSFTRLEPLPGTRWLQAEGENQNRFRVYVQGFDYYNTQTGEVDSGGSEKIAMWMLDPDYDGRSLFPRQVFFPMASIRDGWPKLARSLRAEIDEERIARDRGTGSLPFDAGGHHRIAVKIVDDRGIESLKVIRLD